jgi:ATP-binding cassette subfamily B protein
VLAGTPLLIGVSLVFRGGARRAHRAVRARLARLNGYLQEVLQGIRVVQVFRREQRVSGRFAGLLDSYLAANLRTIFLFALFFPTIDFVVNAIQGSTLWVGGTSITRGGLTYGEFVQFWFYLAMLVAPIRELGERYNILQSAFASAERVFDVLDYALEARAGERAVGRGTGDARPRALRARLLLLRPGVEVARRRQLRDRPGETVAVVGATGAGKSTLVNLLLRFYDPAAGRITIDGIDLKDVDESVLRRSFGLVMQEDFLFAGTVRENLVMEREDVTEETLELALEASRADELIARLPGGLHAAVAERGATFSTASASCSRSRARSPAIRGS